MSTPTLPNPSFPHFSARNFRGTCAEFPLSVRPYRARKRKTARHLWVVNFAHGGGVRGRIVARKSYNSSARPKP
jgi:hypothetical protein